MQKTINFIFIYLVALTACGQNLDCSDFRTGKFVTNTENGDFIILRSDSTQIEYNEKFGFKIKFKVVWIDNCTYKLQPLEILQNQKGLNYPMNLILTTEIIKTDKNSFEQRSTSNISELVLESKLKRIE